LVRQHDLIALEEMPLGVYDAQSTFVFVGLTTRPEHLARNTFTTKRKKLA